VIGFLSSQSADDDYKNLIVPFLQGLKETDYVERQNVAVEYRYAENQYDRLPALAADLVRRRVAVIAAFGIGLVVELLLVRLYLWYLPGALAAPQNGRTNLWLWEAIRLTQQPGLGLVQSWVGVVRPGYAELIGDMFLVPVIQWLVYAVVIYLILEMYLRKSVRATTGK